MNQAEDLKNLRAAFRKIGNGCTVKEFGLLCRQHAGKYYTKPSVVDINKIFNGRLDFD